MQTANYFGTSLDSSGHYFWCLHDHIDGRTGQSFEKLPFDPETIAYTGEFAKNYPPVGWTKIFRVGGYAILYIEGSPYDKRTNSKSVFFFHEDLTDVQLVRKVLSIPAAQKIIKAMPFQVKLPVSPIDVDDMLHSRASGIPAENLNKENFWNALMGQYPQAVQMFCDWIDMYKEKHNWYSLFNNAYRHDPPDVVKFHDIPLDMQIGIIVRFFWCHHMNGSIGAAYQAIRGYDILPIKSHFITMFESLEKQISSGKFPERKQPPLAQ